jgi:hypothetical protein
VNIIELSEREQAQLLEALTNARNFDRRFRLCVDSSGFKFKVGEGMWTPGLGVKAG